MAESYDRLRKRAQNRRIDAEEAAKYIFDIREDMLSDLSDDDDDDDPDFLSPEDLIDDPDADLLPLLDNLHFFLEQDDVEANTEPSDDDSGETPPSSQQQQPVTASTGKSKKKSKVQEKFDWRKAEIEKVDLSWKGEPRQVPGILETPLKYFQKFFDDELLELIVEQSNVFALQTEGCNLCLTAEELKVFMSIILLFGVIKVPYYRMHWEAATRYPQIADKMGRQRFDKIKRFLHFNDNNKAKKPGEQGFDKLYKIRPVLSHIRSKFLEVSPEEHHSIDEQMIPFKGRSNLRQYLPKKPTKWGIKVFTRAGVSGFVYDFEVYQGKGTLVEDDIEPDLGVGGNIVLRLMSTLPEKMNYKIYFDNWFSSLKLMSLLKIKGFPCIGTLNKARLKGCPLLTDGEMKKRERGTSDYRTDIHSGVIVVKWLDNNTVCLASTYAGITPQDTCRRWNVKDKSRVEVSRPAIVYEYNRHMGGVDLADMLAEMCRTHLRTRKWYMRIFWWLIDTAVCNSWLLFRSDVKALTSRTDEPMILRAFRSEVAAGLYASARVMPQRKRARPSADVEASPSPIRSRNRIRPAISAQADGLDHWPKKTEKQSRCKECKSGYTTFECEKCDLPLCLTAKNNCFKAFHTK